MLNKSSCSVIEVCLGNCQSALIVVPVGKFPYQQLTVTPLNSIITLQIGLTKTGRFLRHNDMTTNSYFMVV